MTVSYSELNCVNALIKISKSRGSLVPMSTLSTQAENMSNELSSRDNPGLRIILKGRTLHHIRAKLS